MEEKLGEEIGYDIPLETAQELTKLFMFGEKCNTTLKVCPSPYSLTTVLSKQEVEYDLSQSQTALKNLEYIIKTPEYEPFHETAKELKPAVEGYIKLLKKVKEHDELMRQAEEIVEKEYGDAIRKSKEIQKKNEGE